MNWTFARLFPGSKITIFSLSTHQPAGSDLFKFLKTASVSMSLITLSPSPFCYKVIYPSDRSSDTISIRWSAVAPVRNSQALIWCPKCVVGAKSKLLTISVGSLVPRLFSFDLEKVTYLFLLLDFPIYPIGNSPVVIVSIK